uniref:L-2-hydroxyglutarate dehydrogenase, mitochondrial n=2 Tax=Macrostomum lignano TaxID=282301 RepID=A0A1I8FU56_9PLAT
QPLSTMPGHRFDLAIVGGGIVGAATAREVTKRWPKLRCLLLEKESGLARHQSGHNSGVIHAGIYYQPGSLKAKLCVRGMRLMYDYCDARRLPCKKVGKLIVATREGEFDRLAELKRRGEENRVPDLRLLTNQSEILAVEPNCTGGLRALHSPHTGIADFGAVTRSFGDDFLTSGGEIRLGFELTSVRFDSAQLSEPNGYPLTLQPATGESVSCRRLITCAGLHSDRVAAMTLTKDDASSDSKTAQSPPPPPSIVPFRGDYLVLRPGRESLVRGNIYPVPDPRFPFLGVHFTPRVDGSVWLGPNAVLAFKREGYGLWDISARDLADALSKPGLWRLLAANIGPGLRELRRVIDTGAMVEELRRFVPSLSRDDVARGPSGVRAQALADTGALVDDFVIVGDSEGRVMHVCNAPSPAATSSLAIAEFVADRANEKLGLGLL